MVNHPNRTKVSAERRETYIQAECDRLVQNNVLCCMSSIVSDLANGYGTFQEYQEGPKGNGSALVDLLGQASELCYPLEDYAEAARQEGWTETPEGWWWREPYESETAEHFEGGDGLSWGPFLGSGPFVRAETAEYAAQHDQFDPYQWEVYEHWAVNDWLAEKLEAAGERVGDFGNLKIWGRTTTGQAIGMDGVIRGIVIEMIRA